MHKSYIIMEYNINIRMSLKDELDPHIKVEESKWLFCQYTCLDSTMLTRLFFQCIFLDSMMLKRDYL